MLPAERVPQDERWAQKFHELKGKRTLLPIPSEPASRLQSAHLALTALKDVIRKSMDLISDHLQKSKVKTPISIQPDP